MNLHEQIRGRLNESFVRVDGIARILALAIASGKNILLWGPGGHGKSEMVAQALSCVADDGEIFVQSFGEGMDEATLWGGLDFAALESEKELRYFPQNSFLQKKFAVFEELFDAPASVLLALKDTLTARILRKGNQRFAMKTGVVIALTNKDPQEISDMGPAAHALIERFPLQLRVDWPAYTAADYLELFHKVGPKLPGPNLNGMSSVLAELIAKGGEGASPISPRSAVHALGVIKASAAMRGSNVVEKQDLIDLRFVDGLEQLAATIQLELDLACERAQAERLMGEAEAKFASVMAEFGSATSPIRFLQVARRLLSFQDELANLKVTDGLAERRKKLREAVGSKASEAQQRALDATRI